MTERESTIDARIRRAGLSPIVGAVTCGDQGDVSAQFLVGTSLRTLVGAGETDEEAAEHIIRLACRMGIGK